MSQMRAETGNTLRWRVYPPDHTASGPQSPCPSWMAELQRFRGRIFFGGAVRDQDRNDHPVDADDFDPLCHHVLAYDGNALVGCVRVSAILAQGQLSGYLQAMGLREKTGPDVLQALLRPVIIGRWVVDPAYRASGLGNRLAAGAYVVARSMGSTDGLAVAGTRLGQDRILMRTGTRPFAGTGPFWSDQFGQMARLMHLDPWSPSNTFRGLLAMMEKELGPARSGACRQELQAA